jgi:hypothetical protein
MPVSKLKSEKAYVYETHDTMSKSPRVTILHNERIRGRDIDRIEEAFAQHIKDLRRWEKQRLKAEE